MKEADTYGTVMSIPTPGSLDRMNTDSRPRDLPLERAVSMARYPPPGIGHRGEREARDLLRSDGEGLADEDLSFSRGVDRMLAFEANRGWVVGSQRQPVGRKGRHAFMEVSVEKPRGMTRL